MIIMVLTLGLASHSSGPELSFAMFCFLGVQYFSGSELIWVKLSRTELWWCWNCIRLGAGWSRVLSQLRKWMPTSMLISSLVWGATTTKRSVQVRKHSHESLKSLLDDLFASGQVDLWVFDWTCASTNWTVCFSNCLFETCAAKNSLVVLSALLLCNTIKIIIVIWWARGPWT